MATLVSEGYGDVDIGVVAPCERDKREIARRETVREIIDKND